MNMARKKYQFSYLTIVVIISTIHCSLSQNLTKSRAVFPFDVIRLTCVGSGSQPVTRDASLPNKETCTWTFFASANETVTQTKECFRSESSMTKGHVDALEGYVEVPENVDTFSCAGNDGTISEHIPIHVQRVKLADSGIIHPTGTPAILLQRFSKDYGARLGTHDVTNQEVVINGEEVDSIKLSCISDRPVEWTDISKNKKRVMKELEERDKNWLMEKHKKLDDDLKAYLTFLLETEKDFTERMNHTRSGMEEVIYTLPLLIRRITSNTSRTYECRSLGDETSTSNVTIRVENPQKVGPDEIAMIQQIVAILDSLAQGKGTGGQPWYSLASLLTIILILFMYYTRMKLQQGSQYAPNQCTPKPPDEEAELRAKLQAHSQSQNHNHTESASSAQEESQAGPSNVTSEQPKRVEGV